MCIRGLNKKDRVFALYPFFTNYKQFKNAKYGYRNRNR
jgi:hypothetical protein